MQDENQSPPDTDDSAAGAGEPDRETGDAERQEADRQLPVPVPDPDLTVKADRLAGNVHCLNCGTLLQGPFCHYCGQPDKNFMRFFPVLLRELMEDFLEFDSRFMRTMKPLLFKPGKLTRDYLDGRRFRYSPPLRLYIFSSIACFFIVALLATDAVRIHTDGGDVDGVVTGLQIGEVDDPKVRQALENLEPATRQRVDQALRDAAEATDTDTDAGPEPGDPININGKPWDRETNPFIVSWLPDWVNDWINDEIEESPAKGREISENPNLITDKVFDVLPATMFVLLPLVALLFKFWYLFARKYYIEHLIFALHNHSFMFVILLISVLVSSLASWSEPVGGGAVTSTAEFINLLIWIWVPVYFLVSLKRVYGQGWTMTLAKYCALGISYVMLLGLAAGFVALLSFVLL